MAAPVTRRRWLAAGVVLVFASAATLTLLGSAPAMPSAFRNPLSWFVEPGIAVWWLVLGGPFRSVPDGATGTAFAALANAVLWWVVLWCVVAGVRAVGRFAASRPPGS